MKICKGLKGIYKGKISNQNIIKKLILIVAVIFAFISCKKDRTCQCTTTVSTDTSSFTSSSEITYNHSTKRGIKGLAIIAKPLPHNTREEIAKELGMSGWNMRRYRNLKKNCWR